MYLSIEINKQVNLGEVIVIKSDNNGGIGAFLVSGEKVGKLASTQPEGCVNYWTVAGNIFANRVLCKVAIKTGNTAILQTESALLKNAIPVYGRVVVEGYGMLVAR